MKVRPKEPDEAQRRLHDEAVARGQPYYVDPRTGLYIFTAIGLGRQGHCCGSGCLHCPFDETEQRRAGRPA